MAGGGPRVLAGGLCLLAAASGCTPHSGAEPPAAAASTSARTSPTPAVTTPVPAPVTGPCDMPVLAEDGSFQADAEGGSVAAMVFGSLPVTDGSELKIVWRVTGVGPLTVVARRPNGTEAELAFGPEAHGGSTFSRPGDEWGTGFRFDAVGCWAIEVHRSSLSAHVSIEVVGAPAWN